jgi:hypothetical protein
MTLPHDENLTNGIFRVNFGTLQMRVAVSRELIAQRARELLPHTYVLNF